MNEPATPKRVWKTSGISPGLSAIPPFSVSYSDIEVSDKARYLDLVI